MERDRARARQLAAEYLARGDATGWFEQLYREADLGEAIVPWADIVPSPNLVAYWRRNPLPAAGKTALVVGCGLGDDAEQVAAWGFQTTAFDVAASAIRACRSRFPESPVSYVTADLLNPPRDWCGRFHLVFESNTLQVLPSGLRPDAIRNLTSFVAPGGSLLLIARGREPSEPEGQMPWPLVRREIEMAGSFGLREVSFEDFFDKESPPARRFRALYRKPGMLEENPG